MPTCVTCGSEIANDNPAVFLSQLADWVKSKGSWDTLESDYSYPVGKEFTINGNFAKIVAKKTSVDTGDLDSYGEMSQGTTFDTYIVVQIGDLFFKKTGTGDSYSEVTWDGDLAPVVPVTKTVTLWD